MKIRDARARLAHKNGDLTGASVRVEGRDGLWSVEADHRSRLVVTRGASGENIVVPTGRVEYVAALPRELRTRGGAMEISSDPCAKMAAFPSSGGAMIHLGDWVEGTRTGSIDGLGGLARVERFQVIEGNIMVWVRGAGRPKAVQVALRQLKPVISHQLLEESRQRRRESSAYGRGRMNVSKCPVCEGPVQISRLGNLYRPHDLPLIEGVNCPMSDRPYAFPRTSPIRERPAKVTKDESVSVRTVSGGLPTLGRRAR